MPLFRALALDVIGIDAVTGAIIYGRTTGGGGGLEQDPTDFSYDVGARVFSVGVTNGGAFVVGDAAAVDTTSYGQWNAGSTAAVSPANTGRIRYNQALNQFEQSSNGGAYSAIGGGNTLDGAYDFGGVGAGRAIVVDAGAVTMTNTAADNNNVLELSKSPAGAQTGDALSIAMSATATGLGINADPDADRGFVLGRARIDSRFTDFAYFSHFDMTATSDYGLRQTSTGGTTLNSVATTDFSIANSAQFQLTAANGFFATNANGPALINTASALTTPTLLPDRAVTTTGIGGASATPSLSLVVNGVDEVVVLASNTTFRTRIQPDASNTYSCGTVGQGWKSVYVDNYAIGEVTNDQQFGALGLFLNNFTAAISGTQQYSPTIILEGQGFGVTGAVSVETQWAIQNQPVQDASAVPTSGLHFLTSFSGAAAFVSRLRIDSDSSITAGDNTDTTNIFGRTRIDQRVTDIAYFSHFDRATSTNYALQQNAAGQTIVNCESGQTTLFAVANINVFSVNSTSIFANDANGPALLNEASANNNPTLIPDRTQPNSGIGGSGANVTVVVSTLEVLKVQPTSVVIRQDLIPVAADLGSAALPWTSLFQDGATSMAEMVAPVGLANNARIFAQDNGGGKTELMVIFGTGAAIQLAIEV